MLKEHCGFAEYAIHDALTAIVLGDSLPMDPVILAASPCAAWTAHRALYDKLRLPPISSGESDSNRSLCIVGASGGVGSFTIQMARLSGVQNIIAVCSSLHEDHVRKLGAHQVIDYRREPSIHEALQRITHQEGVDMILDCVGAETTKDAIRSLKFDGMICPIVSFADGGLEGFLKSIVFCQISLGGAHNAGIEARKRLVTCGETVTDLILQGMLTVPVTKTITLEEVPETLQSMLSANNTGKIVLKF
jgi:NADPH2:quinone reductase